MNIERIAKVIARAECFDESNAACVDQFMTAARAAAREVLRQLNAKAKRQYHCNYCESACEMIQEARKELR